MTRLQRALDTNHQRGGLKCPFCGHTGEFDVHRTDTKRCAGQIRRVRICKACGRRVQTIEVVTGTPSRTVDAE